MRCSLCVVVGVLIFFSGVMEALHWTERDDQLKRSSLPKGAKIVHLFALGLSARQFLVPHFQALAESGAHQLLVCSDSPEAREAAERGQLSFSPVRIAQSVSPVADAGAVWRLCRLFRRERPSLIVSHMSKAAAVGMVAAWLSRVASRIYYNHGMAVFSARGPKRALLWVVERLSCACATRVIFCSESTKAEAVRLGLVDPKKAMVVGAGSIAGVDTALFAPQESDKKVAARRLLNIPDGAVAIGFIGRQVPHKGLLTLLDAWRHLKESTHQHAVLVIVGGMPTAAIAEALDAAASEDPSIIIAGTRSNMPSVYAALDAVVLPSWHEGFPYSLLEAQACGVPTIASAVTGNVDAILPEVTGLLVPPRDPDTLASALERIINEPLLRAALGNAGRERICQQFSRERVVAEHVAMYASEVTSQPESSPQ